MKKHIRLLAGLMSVISLFASAEAADWRMVIGSNLNLRAEAADNARVLTRLGIGTLFEVAGERGDWVQGRFADGTNGWLSTRFTRPVDPDERGAASLQLADERLAKTLPFADQADLTDFLFRARLEAEAPAEQMALTARYLRSLQKTTDLLSQAWEQRDQPLYKDWQQAASQTGQIVYSEPSASWLPAPDLAWNLWEAYYPLPEADEIAWIAANLQTPGECEGFLLCVFADMQHNILKYLSFYPAGEHAGEALGQFDEFLGSAGSLEMDIGERPEAMRLLAVSGAILQNLSLPRKQAALKKLAALEQRVAALR